MRSCTHTHTHTYTHTHTQTHTPLFLARALTHTLTHMFFTSIWFERWRGNREREREVASGDGSKATSPVRAVSRAGASTFHPETGFGVVLTYLLLPRQKN